MKIELENGNVIEIIETNDAPVRGRHAKMCELFDVKGGRELKRLIIPAFMRR